MLYVVAEYDEIYGVFTCKEEVAKVWDEKKVDLSVCIYKPNTLYMGAEVIPGEAEAYSSTEQISRELKKVK